MELLKLFAGIFILIILMAGFSFMAFRDLHKREFTQIKNKTKNICLWSSVFIVFLILNQGFLMQYIAETGLFVVIIFVFLMAAVESLFVVMIFNTLLLLLTIKEKILKKR